MIAAGGTGSIPRRQVPAHVLQAAVQRIMAAAPTNQQPGALHHVIAQQLVQHAQHQAMQRDNQAHTLALLRAHLMQQQGGDSSGLGAVSSIIGDAGHMANQAGQAMGNYMAGTHHPLGWLESQFHAPSMPSFGNPFGGGGPFRGVVNTSGVGHPNQQMIQNQRSVAQGFTQPGPNPVLGAGEDVLSKLRSIFGGL